MTVFKAMTVTSKQPERMSNAKNEIQKRDTSTAKRAVVPDMPRRWEVHYIIRQGPGNKNVLEDCDAFTTAEIRHEWKLGNVGTSD